VSGVTASVTRTPEPSLGPTLSDERLHALDAMRGVAILGVLVAYTVWSLGNPPQDSWSRTDVAVARAMDLLVDNKFLTMFAGLFGLGVAQQWRRWQAAGYDPVPLHARRMAFLFCVGLLHGIFLRNGDILAPYALLGFVLLAFRRRSTAVLATAGVLLAITPSVVAGMDLPWPNQPRPGSASYLAENLAWLRYWYLTNPLLSWPRVLAIMLAGLLAGRALIVERLATSRTRAWYALAVAVAFAVLTRAGLDGLSVLWSNQSSGLGHRVALDLLLQVTAWPLAAGYCALLLLLSQSTRITAALWPVRALGRMAFTNYLSQAAILVPVCLVFGLFDRISPTRGLLLAFGVSVLQMAFGTWWLRVHDMGPMERVWRGVTYGGHEGSSIVERGLP
jgi:uncharacterized protein